MIARDLPDNALEVIDYHEAGHAVVGSVLGRRVHLLTRFPSTPGAWGDCQFEPGRYSVKVPTVKWVSRGTYRCLSEEERRRCDDREQNKRGAATAVAGLVAVAMLRGAAPQAADVSFDGPNANDVKEALSLAVACTRSEKVVARFVAGAFNRAQCILRMKWRQVEALTEALLVHGTLDGDEVARITDHRRQ